VSLCVPCKAMEYLLKELSKGSNGIIKVAKLNIDDLGILQKEMI